jgi:hypothetical protein
MSNLNPTPATAITWPTWGAEPTDPPAEFVSILGDTFPAGDWPSRFAALGPGSWPIQAGRTDPEDGSIDWRDAGWLTIDPDGSASIESND